MTGPYNGTLPPAFTVNDVCDWYKASSIGPESIILYGCSPQRLNATIGLYNGVPQPTLTADVARDLFASSFTVINTLTAYILTLYEGLTLSEYFRDEEGQDGECDEPRRCLRTDYFSVAFH